MSIGWIDRVYNNSSKTWYLKSVDDNHNGTLENSGSKVELGVGLFQAVKPHTMYQADWCGIPWYYQGKHYKVIAENDQGNNAIQFYSTELEDKNWVVFEEAATGKKRLRQEVPKGSDFHCYLIFEEEGFRVDVVNNNAFSGENMLLEVYSETKKWVKTAVDLIKIASGKKDKGKKGGKDDAAAADGQGEAGA